MMTTLTAIIVYLANPIIGVIGVLIAMWIYYAWLAFEDGVAWLFGMEEE